MLRHLHSKTKVAAAQSRTMSLVEAVANVVVGYGLAVATQVLVFPMFQLQVSIGETLVIGLIFTIVSIVRSYALRRFFERVRLRGLQRRTAALWRAAAMAGVWAGQLPMR
jgi:hypothetical protein